MRLFQSKSVPLVWFLGCFTLWLVFGTGVYTDDFSIPQSVSHYKWTSMLLPTRETIAFPFEHYTHTIVYWATGFDYRSNVEYFKVLYALLCVTAAFLFFRDYLNFERALVAAFATVFLPHHDATAYSFINYYLSLSVAFYMLAVFCIKRDRWAVGAGFAAMGAFISYGSPALTIGFCALLLLEGHSRKALSIAIPGGIYIIYYLYIAIVLKAGPPRFQPEYSLISLFKGIVVQAVSLVDAVLGPSGWLKVGLSVANVDIAGFAWATALSLLLWRSATGRADNTRVDRRLLIALSLAVVVALGLFALTGRYPQVAFNMGDRVLIFAGIPVAYLIASLPRRTWVLVVAAFFLFISAAGLSAHWKGWNSEQENIIQRIHSRQVWKACPNTSNVLLVVGGQYSRLGPMSHLEFFAESYVASAIFGALGITGKSVVTLGRRFHYEGGKLIDRKHDQFTRLEQTVDVWNAETGLLSCVESARLNELISSLPEGTRHWLQIPAFSRLATIVFGMFPQYGYLGMR